MVWEVADRAVFAANRPAARIGSAMTAVLVGALPFRDLALTFHCLSLTPVLPT